MKFPRRSPKTHHIIGFLSRILLSSQKPQWIFVYINLPQPPFCRQLFDNI
ncbi:hypothetical protein NIES39_J00900 [Arthrospira platensis NIES-39]|nr:hypothetical protein NIES39_J00900 [Arthrospira platensis NIES-39]